MFKITSKERLPKEFHIWDFPRFEIFLVLDDEFRDEIFRKAAVVLRKKKNYAFYTGVYFFEKLFDVQKELFGGEIFSKDEVVQSIEQGKFTAEEFLQIIQAAEQRRVDSKRRIGSKSVAKYPVVYPKWLPRTEKEKRIRYKEDCRILAPLLLQEEANLTRMKYKKAFYSKKIGAVYSEPWKAVQRCGRWWSGGKDGGIPLYAALFLCNLAGKTKNELEENVIEYYSEAGGFHSSKSSFTLSEDIVELAGHFFGNISIQFHPLTKDSKEKLATSIGGTYGIESERTKASFSKVKELIEDLFGMSLPLATKTQFVIPVQVLHTILFWFSRAEKGTWTPIVPTDIALDKNPDIPSQYIINRDYKLGNFMAKTRAAPPRMETPAFFDLLTENLKKAFIRGIIDDQLSVGSKKPRMVRVNIQGADLGKTIEAQLTYYGISYTREVKDFDFGKNITFVVGRTHDNLVKFKETFNPTNEYVVSRLNAAIQDAN